MSENVENLLRRMPLRRPSAALDARILALRPKHRRVWIVSLAGGALAAAAAVLLALALPRGSETGAPVPPSASSTPASMALATPRAPVEFQENYSQVSYEGVVAPDNVTPLQQFRRHTVERVQWVDAARGLKFETTTPRDEIILVSASMQ